MSEEVHVYGVPKKEEPVEPVVKETGGKAQKKTKKGSAYRKNLEG